MHTLQQPLFSEQHRKHKARAKTSGQLTQPYCCLVLPAGGLVLTCASGHIFYGTAKPLGGYSNWKLLTTLPAAVTSMCSTDPKVAPVAIQRC
jgi:hypothetical protein